MEHKADAPPRMHHERCNKEQRRVVVVMYDTLCRHFLPSYGNDWVRAPNFTRLARRTTQFSNFYVGSMPCMPARR